MNPRYKVSYPTEMEFIGHIGNLDVWWDDNRGGFMVYYNDFNAVFASKENVQGNLTYHNRYVIEALPLMIGYIHLANP